MKYMIKSTLAVLGCIFTCMETFAQSLPLNDKLYLSVGIGPALNLQSIERYGNPDGSLAIKGGPMGWGIRNETNLNILVYKILYTYIGLSYHFSSIKYNLNFQSDKNIRLTSHSVNAQLGLKAQKFVSSRLGIFVSAGSGVNTFNLLHKNGLTTLGIDINDYYVVQSRAEINAFRFLTADFGVGTIYKKNSIFALFVEVCYNHPVVKYTATTLSYEKFKEKAINPLPLPLELFYKEEGLFALKIGASINLLSKK